MLAIQPLGLGRAQEELRPVRVGPGVGHGQNSRSGVLEVEVLVLELVAVDGLASSTVSSGEIATLNKKKNTNAISISHVGLKTE